LWAFRTVLQTVRVDHRYLTVISAFNSLTLSPALAALLLKAHDAKKDRFTRAIDFAFGWFFKLLTGLWPRIAVWKARHAHATVECDRVVLCWPIG